MVYIILLSGTMYRLRNKTKNNKTKDKTNGGPAVLVRYVALIVLHGIGQITQCIWRCGSLVTAGCLRS